MVFYACFDQMQNNFISQAKQMETYDVPNDMIPAMNQVACIVLGPIIQYGFYPFLHRRNIQFNPTVRITVGFACIAISMLYATLVQVIIYGSPPCFNRPGNCDASKPWGSANHVNIWIQTPIYLFVAIGEIFALVTALEYAYDNSPKNMKATVQAINLLVASIGSACAMGLIPIAHDPYLVMLYASLTRTRAVATIIFWVRFRKYDKVISINGEDNVSVELKTGPKKDEPLMRNLASSFPSPDLSNFLAIDGADCQESNTENGFKAIVAKKPQTIQDYQTRLLSKHRGTVIQSLWRRKSKC